MRLENVTGQALVLDPRQVRGRWLARVLATARRAPAGDTRGGDVTTLVLVSDRPFEENAR